MRKIMFLDIDGVLNHETGYRNGNCKPYEMNGHIYEAFDPTSKELLNKLIELTGADIVISSSWRSDGLGAMQELWSHENMLGEVIGITPSLPAVFSASLDCLGSTSMPRGIEIDAWLNSRGYRHINGDSVQQEKYMEQSKISQYVIIDDDSDMLYNQRKHFVHVLDWPSNVSGFNMRCYNKALAILSQTVIEL